jgi:hypothetical protein
MALPPATKTVPQSLHGGAGDEGARSREGTSTEKILAGPFSTGPVLLSPFACKTFCRSAYQFDRVDVKMQEASGTVAPWARRLPAA